MASEKDQSVSFLQSTLPKLGYQWEGFRKPRGQILKRIRNRMQELGLSGGYPEYRTYLEEHPEEWATLDRLCDVTISKFFRDRKLWDDMLYNLIRKWAPGPVSVWSAGCCNGEEAYSMAMINEQLSMNNGAGSEIFILGSDRNPEVLDRARERRYPVGALKELTIEEIQRFFHPVEDGGEDDYQIDERLAWCVEFEQRDIRESMPDQVFDLVLCRNLAFTYFNETEQLHFLERLRYHIKPGGYLIIGSNEVLPSGVEWPEPVSETHPVYKAGVRGRG